MSGADTVLYSADGDPAWTLPYPASSVVVPNANIGSVSIVFGLPEGAPQLTDCVDTWVAPNKSGWTLDRLYNYWTLDKGADEKKSRRSVIQNVFGWQQD